MRRREVLRSLTAPSAALLTGCTGVVGGAPNPFEITSVDSTVTVDFPLSLAVSVHRRQATSQRPAALTVRWQNNSNRTIRLVDAGVLSLDDVPNEEENALLLNRAAELEATEFSSCWIYTPDVLSGPGVVKAAMLDPGDTLEATSGIYSFKSGVLVVDECLPAGDYTFTPIGAIDNLNEELYVEIDWQLDVTLSR